MEGGFSPLARRVLAKGTFESGEKEQLFFHFVYQSKSTINLEQDLETCVQVVNLPPSTFYNFSMA